jgi:DNA repair protein RecO (recombination protein O)
MDFADDAIVLGSRPHGETHSVAELFMAQHGRWAALVHGGQGRRRGPVLQPGNLVRAEWKGRGDSLGYFALELARANAAALMDDRLSLTALAATCGLARAALPEREPHSRAFEAMRTLIAHLDDHELWPPLLARFELGLLAELGYGLTLDRCAATGAREHLIYVSPKSACAVSRGAGEPYKDRLLPLPRFLIDASAPASLDDAIAGLKTTAYFLESRLLKPFDRDLPEPRRRLEELLRRAVAPPVRA